MTTFSYNTLRSLARTIPICPKPKFVGLENIPEEGPIIYAHNHITRRTEGFFMMEFVKNLQQIIYDTLKKGEL